MNKNFILKFSCALLFFIGLLSQGCSSMGHSSRAIPKIEKRTDKITEVGLDGDENELAASVENFLEARGIKVRILGTPQVKHQRGDKEYTYDEVQTRFVVRVRSTDLDTCLPEGSRQMHFTISVTDFQERNKVFLMNGEFGCKDTLINSFNNWLNKQPN